MTVSCGRLHDLAKELFDMFQQHPELASACSMPKKSLTLHVTLFKFSKFPWKQLRRMNHRKSKAEWIQTQLYTYLATQVPLNAIEFGQMTPLWIELLAMQGRDPDGTQHIRSQTSYHQLTS